MCVEWSSGVPPILKKHMLSTLINFSSVALRRTLPSLWTSLLSASIFLHHSKQRKETPPETPQKRLQGPGSGRLGSRDPCAQTHREGLQKRSHLDSQKAVDIRSFRPSRQAVARKCIVCSLKHGSGYKMRQVYSFEGVLQVRGAYSY